ncbi:MULTISPECIES: hypothetical protein [unclassified Streptomyces]|uniref:hypothetical protein n=1 Tax=unclassified Streptomyces TaxID=2593676 RepID=UPI00340C5E56
MSHQTPAGKHDSVDDKDDKDTALGEVLHELEDAAKKPEEPAHGRRDPQDGEAGDALTPNTEAQKRAGR